VPIPPPSLDPWTRHLGVEAVVGVLGRATVLAALHGVAEVDSTQDVALDLARDGAASGTVVVADRQVLGRGRRGRRWDDAPDGGSLAMTVLLDAPARDVTLVPLAAGLAVADAVTRLPGVPGGVPGGRAAVLKWPNDVVVRTEQASHGPGAVLRKLAGILVQLERVGTRDVLLIGVGLNVDHRALPPVADRICVATLQGLPAGRALPAGRGEILAGVLEALDGRLQQLLGDPDHGPTASLDAYRAASDTLGRHVDVDLLDGRRLTGTVLDVDATGALVVEVDGRTETVVAGTVREHGVADRRSEP